MAWGLSLLALAPLINTFAGSLYTHHAMRESTARPQAEVALFTALRMRTFLRREIERLENAGAAMMVFSVGGEQQRRVASLLLKTMGQSRKSRSLTHKESLCSGSLQSRLIPPHRDCVEIPFMVRTWIGSLKV